MLVEAENSQLILIDTQERFISTMNKQIAGAMLTGCEWLIQSANLLGIPIVVSEQYPQAMGSTDRHLLRHLANTGERIAKTSFSCADVPAFQQRLNENGRQQIILMGMEAHVCVLQTAIQLLEQGKQVFVVEDATCSRSTLQHSNAMQRMRQAGIIITNTESVMFEWLRHSKHEMFKQFSALIKETG